MRSTAVRSLMTMTKSLRYSSLACAHSQYIACVGVLTGAILHECRKQREHLTVPECLLLLVQWIRVNCETGVEVSEGLGMQVAVMKR
jgi:hypothetical protein